MARRRANQRPLEDYAYERINRFHQFGAVVQDPGTVWIGDRRVIVQGLLVFGRRQQALLWIYEVVELENGVPRRTKYDYHYSYDGGPVFRYDRDAVQHPRMPEHKHIGPSERRVRWSRVTLQEVVDEVVEHVAAREEDEELDAV